MKSVVGLRLPVSHRPDIAASVQTVVAVLTLLPARAADFDVGFAQLWLDIADDSVTFVVTGNTSGAGQHIGVGYVHTGDFAVSFQLVNGTQVVFDGNSVSFRPQMGVAV